MTMLLVYFIIKIIKFIKLITSNFVLIRSWVTRMYHWYCVNKISYEVQSKRRQPTQKERFHEDRSPFS